MSAILSNNKAETVITIVIQPDTSRSFQHPAHITLTQGDVGHSRIFICHQITDIASEIEKGLEYLNQNQTKQTVTHKKKSKPRKTDLSDMPLFEQAEQPAQEETIDDQLDESEPPVTTNEVTLESGFYFVNFNTGQRITDKSNDICVAQSVQEAVVLGQELANQQGIAIQIQDESGTNLFVKTPVTVDQASLI